jgi:uncharacterized membrane protein YeaQ/YmgE (transglycosylase-associated protein family)
LSTLTAILLWILLGAVAGWIANAIMGGRGSFWGDVLLGIVGALVGGFIFRMLGLPTAGMGWSLLTAIIGAVILIALIRAFTRRPVMNP